jgi:hypothetical protein
LAWDQWSQYLAPWRVSGGTVMPQYVLSCRLACSTFVSFVVGQEHLSGLRASALACLPA